MVNDHAGEEMIGIRFRNDGIDGTIGFVVRYGGHLGGQRFAMADTTEHLPIDVDGDDGSGRLIPRHSTRCEDIER